MIMIYDCSAGILSFLMCFRRASFALVPRSKSRGLASDDTSPPNTRAGQHFHQMSCHATLLHCRMLHHSAQWTGWSGRSQSQRPATTAFHRGTAVATLPSTTSHRLSPRHCCCATLPFTALTPRHCRCDRRDIVVEYPSGSFFGELEFLGFGQPI